MIRFLLRFIGLWLLAGGFVALVVDGTRSIASSELVMTGLGEAWFALNASSLTRIQHAVETGLSPRIWDYVGVPVLMTPLAASLAVLGILLLLLGRTPREKVTVLR
ncbi:hypothetical protein MWN34_03690 [Ancylobacter sp. 6x-1]|uniref:PetM family of cytochrome b6f complex subunit 7 n=1 Tax=Ancylobacter crimeensis TaxID=2579147 RepID=A0ABT0D7W0_9HYPH|nr:hypothetical protein [Ancylobacter crimeensis]MCK0196009.1 hypothetical protein [Ancylobacter crimeensis]